MKAKVKFDSAQLKAFLLHHVEKLVFGGFVVAFLLLCWSAFKLKPYPKTPDQLKATADRVSQEVDKAVAPDKFADLPSVPDFSNLGAVGPAAVDPRLYKIDPISRPYEDRQELRKEPKFFALVEPLVFAGYGGIAINEKGGGVERFARSGLGSGGGMDPTSAMGGMAGGMMGYNPGGYGPPTMTGGPMPGMDPTEMMKSMGQGYPGGMSPGGGPMGGMNPMMPGMGGAAGRGRGRQKPRRPNAKKEAPKAPVARPKPQATERIVLPNPAQGSKVEGRYWVCLAGAIPFRKEFLEYQATFRDARGYDIKRDYPRYALPEIERAEVIGDKMGPWRSLDLDDALSDRDKWAMDYPEIVDKDFLDPDLTEPLPPLIFANHDKDKVSHPRARLVEQQPKAAVEQGPKKRKPQNLSGARHEDLTGGRFQARGVVRNNYAGGLASQLPEYRLFRFFDFSVEPGKTYRYRVKLALVNPNADVMRRYLENYAFLEGATRAADWSSPSPPITVIAGNRLLAGTVSPGRTEPTGSVMAKLFDANQAVEVRKVFTDIRRGAVLNQREMEIGVPDSSGGTGKTAATVDVETDAVVLDMFGGEKLPGAKSRPSEAPPRIPGRFLVLDNDGALKTLTQSSDAAMYETEAEEAKKMAPPTERERKGGAQATDAPDPGFFNFGEPAPKPKKPGRR